MKLSQLCLLLGLGYAMPNFYGYFRPREFGEWLRTFPRNLPWGIVLILLATLWFEWNLYRETISDFAAWKPALQLLFGLTGIGCCFYLQDYLSIRALAVLMLLLAHAMLETQRWHENLVWKNVVTVWAYVIAIMGMWFVISPWRARDWINWNTADQDRLKRLSAIRAGFGTFVAVLGLTVLKS